MTTEQQLIDNIKSKNKCGYCIFYSKNGFCSHILSNDKCADRDTVDVCNINQYKYDENKFDWSSSL